MSKSRILSVAVLFGVILLVSCNKPAKSQARVFFKSPANGAVVTSPVKFQFGTEGIKVGKAGARVEGVGHHHLIINGGSMPAGSAVPADETHIHYGKAQTEAEVVLKPGKYKVTMQLADGLHVSYGPALSATIEITVK